MTNSEFLAEIERLKGLKWKDTELDTFTDTYSEFLIRVARGSTPEELPKRRRILQELIVSQSGFVFGLWQQGIEVQEQAKDN